MKIIFLTITLVKVQKVDNIIQESTMGQETGPLIHFGGNTKWCNPYRGYLAESSSITILFDPGRPTLRTPQN